MTHLMTHFEGNSQIYLPQKMHDRLSKSLKGQADSLLPKGPVIFFCAIMLKGTQSKKYHFN